MKDIADALVMDSTINYITYLLDVLFDKENPNRYIAGLPSTKTYILWVFAKFNEK